MTTSLREAHPSKHRFSLAAVRSWLLLTLLVVFGASVFAPSASAQGLSPGTAHAFGARHLGSTLAYTFQFSGPSGGSVTIGTITVITEGAPAKDFKVVPVANECSGTVYDTSSCNVEVTFSPTQIGLRLGALIVTNTGGTVVNTIYLSGTGVGPQFVFAPTTAVTTNTSAITGAFTAGAGVLDGNGDLFFTDVANNRILERSSTGVYSLVTALPVSVTSGITIDGAGNLYVSSGATIQTIRYGTTTATAFPIPAGITTLSAPTGLAVDNAGHLYVADSISNQIYEIPLDGSNGSAITLNPAVALSGPTGLAIDDNDNLYIADSGNSRIVKVALIGDVSSIPTITGLSDPTGVAVDPAGTIYVANTGGSNIIEVPVIGTQFTLTENPALTLATPSGIVLQANGDLTVTDTTDGLIDIARSSPTVNFPTPTLVGTLDATTGEDPETLTVQETGNIPSRLDAGTDPSFTGTNPTAFLLATTGSCPSLTGGAPTAADTFAIGEVCTYDLNFKPTVVGPNLANLVLTTTAAGALTTTNTAKLTGIGISTVDHFTLVAISVPATTPTTVNLHGSVELVLTAIKSDGSIATDYTGNVIFTSTDTTGLYLGGSAPTTSTSTYIMTAADNGVLTIPVGSGLQLNQYGVFQAIAAPDLTYAPNANPHTATSNNIYVNSPSTLALTSSINPSLVNQSTTFTLTITATGAGAASPAGTVTFFSDGVQIGAPQTVTGSGLIGTASIPDSFPAVGSYTITATYTPTSTTVGGTASLIQVVGLPTAVILTSSINPSLVGQATNLTATITAVASPTGTVTFYNGPTAISGPINVTATGTTGTATFPATFLTAGSFPITAVYTSTSANPDVASATSNTVIQVVLNPSTLTLTSSVNPSQVGQQTIFTLTVAAGGTPGGTVTFYSDGASIGTVNVTGGAAHLPYSFAAVGTYAITAVYTGDTLTHGGTAGPLSQKVVNTTVITLVSSLNPSLVNQSVTFTATLSALGTPTGTINFYDGATLIGTAPLAGTTGSVSYTFTTVGTHPITAVYSGDAHTNGATSAILQQHVLNVAALTLTSSVNPSLPGQNTTLTATLVALGTPGGTLKFYDGTTLIGTATLPTNSVTVSFATPGNHILTAVYSGDANTETITSPPLTQVVLYATTATLTSSVNPVNVNANTTLTATINATTGTPTGTVTFKSNGITIGTRTLSGGVATLVTSFPLPGVYTLVAVYAGDANDQPATTNTVRETVINVVTIGLASSVNPVFLDNPTVLTATLTTLAVGIQPTGTVNFFDGTTPIGTGAIVNGMASVTASFVYAGNHNITAVYAGDASDSPATSPPYAQTVADFSLTLATGSSNTASTIAGGTAAYSLVVTPIITSTLPGPITLTVTGLPTTVTGTLTPATIAAGSGTTPVAFAVTAATLLQSQARLQRPPVHRSPMGYAPVTLALLALPLAWFRRRKRFAALFASMCLLFAITAGLSGCISAPSNGYYGETPQTYNLTVTATSGNLTRSTNLTLTVQ